jgi:hypothetical protein
MSLFANEDMREALNYGDNYFSTPSSYQDVFDGSVIQGVINNDRCNTVFKVIHTIYIGVIQDGFTSKLFYNKIWSFTLFQVVFYSLSPSLRYVTL